MCSPTWETHIPSDMCSTTQETHIPSDVCSSIKETYMCSPTQETHIPSDIGNISLVICVTLPRKHISLVICVPLPGKHITLDKGMLLLCGLLLKRSLNRYAPNMYTQSMSYIQGILVSVSGILNNSLKSKETVSFFPTLHTNNFGIQSNK